MCTVVKSSFQYVCVMTYLCAWHDSFVRGTRPMYSILHTRRLPACGSWLIHLCDMTYTYFRADGSGDVCHDTHMTCVCVSWHTHTECVITCVFGGHDTFICVTHMTHSFVGHTSSICVTEKKKMSPTCHTYEWGMPSHTHMNELCVSHICERIKFHHKRSPLCHTYEWGMLYKRISCMSRSYVWWVLHVPRRNESCPTKIKKS